jgi:hypothetical protein
MPDFSASVLALFTAASTGLEFFAAYLARALLLSPETILTTESRVSDVSHSGPALPHPLSKSKIGRLQKIFCRFRTASSGLVFDNVTASFCRTRLGKQTVECDALAYHPLAASLRTRSAELDRGKQTPPASPGGRWGQRGELGQLQQVTDRCPLPTTWVPMAVTPSRSGFTIGQIGGRLRRSSKNDASGLQEEHAKVAIAALGAVLRSLPAPTVSLLAGWAGARPGHPIFRPPKLTHTCRGRLLFGGSTEILGTAYAFRSPRREGPHRFIQIRPRAFVSVPWRSSGV